MKNIIHLPSGSSMLAAVLVVGLTSAGCTLVAVAQTEQQPGMSAAELQGAFPAPAGTMDQSTLMYEIMISELAGRRGYVDIATEGYYSAAQRTDDARVSERATRLAVWGRRWQQAEQAARRWSELAPDNIEVHQILAQIFMRQGDSESAAWSLKTLIEMSTLLNSSDDSQPTEEATTQTLAAGELTQSGAIQGPVSMTDVYAFLQREPNQKVALDTMKRLRDLYEGDSYASLAVAQLAYDSTRYDDALEAADHALELDADNHQARLLRTRILGATGKGAQAFQDLKGVLEKQGASTELQLGYARLLVEAGRFEEAAETIALIFEQAPDNADAIHEIALLSVESRRLESARIYFKRLLELESHESSAHYFLAQIADTRQEFEEAIAHYDQVTAEEERVHARMRSAELKGLLGNVDEARAQLREIASTHPNPEIRPLLVRSEGRILQQAGRIEAALSVLTQGVDLFPDHPDLRYSRALLADSVGEHDVFVSDMRRLIEADPGNAHALNALGYHFADQNINLDEAEEFLVRANELLPSDPAILDSLGWLKFRRGETGVSLKLLREAYSLLKDAEIAAHLGEVLWVSGEQDSARAVWDEALKAQPDDKKLLEVMDRLIQ